MCSFFSQNGEDQVLSKIFKQIPGVCVEVGAHNGVDLSNTYHFEQIGWTCILVEPNPILCRDIRQRRSANSTLFECAASNRSGMSPLNVGLGTLDVYSTLVPLGKNDSAERFRTVVVPVRTLDSMLQEAGIRAVDFISIDVEGHELSVLQGLSLSRWNPRVVLVEDNSDLVDGSVREHMERAGYFRFYRTGVNDWYARRGEGRLTLLKQILASGRFSWRGLLKGSAPAAAMRRFLLFRKSVLANLRVWQRTA
jgi:FkbM family methyltransferase